MGQQTSSTPTGSPVSQNLSTPSGYTRSGRGASKGFRVETTEKGGYVEKECSLTKEVSPERYLAPGQFVVNAGNLWKLNTGADVDDAGEWLRRKMWLTNQGGLFYYSRQFDEPLGCYVSGLTVEAVEGTVCGRYALQLKPGDAKIEGTFLAADTEKERDTWVQKIIETDKKAGAVGELDPLEPFGPVDTECDRIRLQSKKSERVALAVSQRSTAGRRNSGRGQAMGRVQSFSCHMMVAMKSNLQEFRNIASVAREDLREEKNSTERKEIRKSTGPMGIMGRILDGQKRKPETKRNSQVRFCDKSDTMLILDWDDTLFPTTFIRHDCGLDRKRTIRDQVEESPGRDELERLLDALSDRVETFLSLAVTHARVVIITLAKAPWVQMACKNFMPRILDLIEKHNINVIHARDCIPQESKDLYAATAFKTPDDEAEYWMRAKAVAMKQEIDDMHNTAKISWKNIISMGDSDFERVALLTTAEEYVAKETHEGHLLKAGTCCEIISPDGHFKRSRFKVLKMIEEPSYEELFAEMGILTLWLPHVVRKDDGMDVELMIGVEDQSDNEALEELHKEITGLDEKVTWEQFAGTEPDASDDEEGLEDEDGNA